MLYRGGSAMAMIKVVVQGVVQEKVVWLPCSGFGACDPASCMVFVPAG